MDVSKKITTDAKNAFNELASERSSSSNNNSPDPSSRANQPEKFQDSAKSPKITKSTVNTKITELASTMLNISQNENHKSSTLTTNVTGKEDEEESRVEISGRIIDLITIHK